MNGGRVTSSVRALGAQRFVASFTPHEPGVHTVQITFNGSTVPGKTQLLQMLYRMKTGFLNMFIGEKSANECGIPLLLCD